TAMVIFFALSKLSPFLKSMLRKIATGLGLSYNSFANDLEGVNFSSMRSGLLNERDNWMCEQTLFRLLFLEPVFDAFLRNALLAKAINKPYAKLNEYRKHKWQGRRWPWVDPRADVQANSEAIKFKIKNPFTATAETGEDLEDIFRGFARAKKLADKYGVDISGWDATSNKQTNEVDDGGNKADENNTNRNIIKLAS
ncbi:MAG: phage portal protein, partial [Ignavibacteriales bacterium]